MPLTIYFNKIIADLKAAGEALYNSNDEEVKQVAVDNFNTRNDRLLFVAESYATGQIDEDFLLKRLEDEKDLLISEAKSFAVKGLKVAEDAANTGIEILTGAITDILEQLTPAPITDPENQPVDKTLNMGEVPEEESKLPTTEKKTLE